MYDFKELEDYLNTSLDRFGIGCLSVAISSSGKLVYDTYKKSEKEEYANFSDYTRLNVGGITNTVIGALIIKLIELGEITAYDYVKNYIPEFTCESVRVIHLLTHTSGISLVGITEDQLTKENGPSLAQIYAALHQTQIPGTQAEYFDYGYTILVDLMNRVTKTNIEEFAHDVLFRPLDLRRTSFMSDSLTENNLIMPLDVTESKFIDCSNTGEGNVALYTVASDLVKFGSLFTNYHTGRKTKVLSDAGFAFALTPAYFDQQQQYPKTPIFYHRSALDQYLCFGDLSSPNTLGRSSMTGCMLSIDLDNDVVIAITSNSCKLSTDQTNFKKIINRAMASFESNKK